MFEVKAEVPFGIIHNNPGRIPWSEREVYQGLADPPSMVDPENGERLFKFKTPGAGIRAIVARLKDFYDKKLAADGSPVDTVSEICACLDAENADVYSGFVLAETGFVPRVPIDVHDPAVMEKLVRAIIRFENGTMPYTDAQIEKGLVMGGMEGEAKPLRKSRTIQGSMWIGGWTGIAAVTEYAQELVSQVTPALPLLRYFAIPKWVVFAGMALGIIAVVLARIDDRKKGLR